MSGQSFKTSDLTATVPYSSNGEEDGKLKLKHGGNKMNKKIISTLVIGTLIAGTLAGCGGSSDAGSSAKSSSGKTELELFPQNLRTRIRFRNW